MKESVTWVLTEPWWIMSEFFYVPVCCFDKSLPSGQPKNSTFVSNMNVMAAVCLIKSASKKPKGVMV
jgi:hypothetical protein